MPRRSQVKVNRVEPDAKYQNLTVAQFINRMMKNGKKSTSEKVVYGALAKVEGQDSKTGVAVMEQAVKNATPQLEVKSRRIGGATYQVPVEVQTDRGLALAIRWLIASARARSGKSMSDKLASELGDAAKGQGATVKKRDDTHKMAEANRAFAHYRW